MALVSLSNVRLSFSGPPLLEGVSLQLEAGDRFCLIGRNGTGKTTLLKLIAGEMEPDAGEIARLQGLRTAIVSQEMPRGIDGTVFDVVAGAMERHPEDAAGRARIRGVDEVLSRLSLSPDAPFAHLSGGTKRRALLAQALALDPDILLLDEPTNHLDIDGIAWLEEFLLKRVKTLLFVTHDRAFARRVSNRVAELDRGHLYAFDCGYDAFVARREELLTAEIRRQAAFDKRLAGEEVWVRKGIKARRTRDEGRVKALERMREERRARRSRIGTARITIQDAERSGTLVAEAEGASVGFGGEPVIKDLTTTIVRGDRVGIIGPNGSGKTTLLRLLLGELAPSAGRVRHGSRLEVLYFDQMREGIDPEKTVMENVAEGNDTVTINGRARHVIGYLGDFLFTPERSRSPVSVLSGGERNRLLLAKLFTRPSNVLVMDEPTNDLDVETLDLLEELLAEYAGTLLLVSHDREFLDNVVTSTLVLAGDGRVREYVGGYGDWLRESGRERAATPMRETKPPPVAKAAGGPPAEKPARPRRLTFKEARELESLPARLEALEEEQAGLHRNLADPAWYRAAGPAVGEATARLAALDREYAEAYHRWEELEGLRG